jgi:hypothetical protein
MSLNGLRPTAQDHGTESSDSFVSLSWATVINISRALEVCHSFITAELTD